MSTLLEKIKADQLAIRKADAVSPTKENSILKNLLTTLIGEVELHLMGAGVIINEDGVTESVVKSFVKKNLEFQDLSKDVDYSGGNLKKEYDQLIKYLPKQLSNIELTNILFKEFQEPLTMKDKGRMMGYLSKTYPNQFDGKEAVSVVNFVIETVGK